MTTWSSLIFIESGDFRRDAVRKIIQFRASPKLIHERFQSKFVKTTDDTEGRMLISLTEIPSRLIIDGTLTIDAMLSTTADPGGKTQQLGLYMLVFVPTLVW